MAKKNGTAAPSPEVDVAAKRATLETVRAKALAATTAATAAQTKADELNYRLATDEPGVAAAQALAATADAERLGKEAAILVGAERHAAKQLSDAEDGARTAAEASSRKAKLDRCAALGEEAYQFHDNVRTKLNELLALVQPYMRVCAELDREGLAFERRRDLSRHLAPGAVADRLATLFDVALAHVGRPVPPHVEHEREQEIADLIEEERTWIRLFSQPDPGREGEPAPVAPIDAPVAAPEPQAPAGTSAALLLDQPRRGITYAELPDREPGPRRGRGRARGLDG